METVMSLNTLVTSADLFLSYQDVLSESSTASINYKSLLYVCHLAFSKPLPASYAQSTVGFQPLK